MTLNEAIEQPNRRNQLGLIPFTIPGFPSCAEHDAIVRMLDRNASVSIVETTIPVSGGFSPHANQMIRRAHRVASAHGVTMPTRRRYGVGKPRLYVLYRQTVIRLGFDEVLRRLRGHANGVLLEWNERRKDAEYAAACRSAGIELVQCVGPSMNANEIDSLMNLTGPRPLVYLMSAPRTGGRLFEHENLARCAERIRRHRPAARIAAGFGIATPEHLRTIGGVPGVDAVIVGTAFLKAIAQGVCAGQQFLRNITDHLRATGIAARLKPKQIPESCSHSSISQ